MFVKGFTTRDILDAFKEMYDADASAALISKVTDSILETVTERQNRSLDVIYPIAYLDCIVLKVRQNNRVINKSMYLTPGINMESHKRAFKHVVGRTEG